MILTVADASGLHESNMQFLFLKSHESSLHLMTRLPWRRNGTNPSTNVGLQFILLFVRFILQTCLLMHKSHNA